MNRCDMVGKKYSRLTVTKLLKGQKCECVCDCGNTITTYRTHLRSGHTKSCGCLAKEINRQRCMERNTTHNLTNHPLYNVYNHMKQRCYKPTTEYMKECYKDRNITICDEWLGDNGFVNFFNWAIANGWTDERTENGRRKLTLDRIDNDKGYSPSNCRWTSYYVQTHNRRKPRKKYSVGIKNTSVIHYGGMNNG